VARRSCPTHWFAGRVHEVLDEVTAGGPRVSTMSVAETAESIRELCRAQARIEALKLQLLAHGDHIDVAQETSAVSTGAWLADQTRAVRGRAHGLIRLARHLDAGFDDTGAAFLRGAIDVDQVHVITDAVTALPRFVGPADRRRAELHLLALAELHDAKALKLLAKHLHEVIDPDGADAELARRLKKEEDDAARKAMLTMYDDGNGTCHGRFRIPTLHGAMLATALNALASPRRPDAIARELPDTHETDSHGDPEGALVQRPTPEILGQAFTELLERYPTKKLPRTGGGLATVLVTIPLEVLEGRLGVATLSTGGHLIAGAARRLACSHGLIPQVLGARSEPLDQGRRTRLHTEPQRIAMAARDKTCTAEGCATPASWCLAHHRVPWAQGGRTSVKDGRMVCPRHHTMIHHPDHAAEYLPSGKIRITRRHRQ
jgi:hypothetical protein